LQMRYMGMSLFHSWPHVKSDFYWTDAKSKFEK
jgi:hypothetical protein